MKVIMLKDVRRVGTKNSIIEVSDGYAINHLLPNKLAETATPDVIARTEAARVAQEKEKTAAHAQRAEQIQSLKNATVEISVRATPKGGLFKAIGAADIARAVQLQKGVAVPAQLILLEQPIKQAGDHAVTLSDEETKVSLNVRVVASA